MNTYDKCKNCGGEYGLHHFETNQCPVGGREAPIGRKQEWKTTTFEKEDDSATVIAALTEFIKEVFDEMDYSKSRKIRLPQALCKNSIKSQIHIVKHLGRFNPKRAQS